MHFRLTMRIRIFKRKITSHSQFSSVKKSYNEYEESMIDQRAIERKANSYRN